VVIVFDPKTSVSAEAEIAHEVPGVKRLKPVRHGSPVHWPLSVRPETL